MSGRQQKRAEARREHAERIEAQAERAGKGAYLAAYLAADHILAAGDILHVKLGDPVVIHDLSEWIAHGAQHAVELLVKGAAAAPEHLGQVAQRAATEVAKLVRDTVDVNRNYSQGDLTALVNAHLAQGVERNNHDHGQVHQHGQVHDHVQVPQHETGRDRAAVMQAAGRGGRVKPRERTHHERPER